MSPGFRRRIRRVSPYPLTIALLLVPAPAACRAADSSHTARPELRLPADIVFASAVAADSAVTFRHSTHVGFAGGTCTGCHPKPFHMLRPTHRAGHAATSCGACHDGRQSFGVREETACGLCHAGRGGGALAVKDSARAPAAPRVKGPAPHVYPRGGDSPGPVTFRHATHLRPGGTCAGCHPKPFAMRFSPPRPDGGMHEATACGACHDGKRTFDAQDPAACNRCHSATGARP